MSLSDKMKDFAGQVQEDVKTSTMSLAILSLRILTGLFVGTTLAVIAQELMGFGTFAFIFFVVVMIGLFLKISSQWRIPQILIFNLIYVLMGQLLRMYILLAP